MSKINELGKLEIEELKKLGKLTKENIKKIEIGYPIQYLIGYVDFYGRKINVNKNTLVPRYETEYLIEKTLKYINKYNLDNSKVLDMCTGSGCIGLTLKAEKPSLDVTLSDISSKALKVAKQNKEELNLNVKIIKSDLFEKIKDKNFDVLISNPPYVMTSEILPKEVTYEPELALFSGEKGTDHIENIIKKAKAYLNDKYLIALEINEQSKKSLEEIVKKYMSECTYSFEEDMAGKLRYLFIFKNLE